MTSVPSPPPASDLLRLLQCDTQSITARFLAGIERALGPCPRLQLPPGTRLIEEGVEVKALFLVLRGRIALEQATADGDLQLHHSSTGSLVGLLSLFQQQEAFFTARATTEIEIVEISFAQLDQALVIDPSLGTALAALSSRALARRLRRADQLQVEKIRLNRSLEQERQRLAEALHQLDAARVELVEQARFATLGELAAGIAHDLNNPVTAMMRAASFIGEDLERLLRSHPRGPVASAALTAERERPPRSTSEERAARRVLETALGDSALAQRLVRAGIEDPERARALARDPESLDLIESAAGLGASLRNIEVAARRMCELVESLRAYSRPKGEPVADVDLHVGLEDTLRLMGHRLREVQIERHYGILPRIRCHPGELGQLWTNLLSNALEALPVDGRIELTTDAPDAQSVRVRIQDNGRGIDPAILPRVFEPRFTTKAGSVRYGLGLGLAIARRIVDSHGGTIGLVSAPGRTRITVTLPVNGPLADEEFTI